MVTGVILAVGVMIVASSPGGPWLDSSSAGGAVGAGAAVHAAIVSVMTATVKAATLVAVFISVPLLPSCRP